MNEPKRHLSFAEAASLVWQRRKTALLAAGVFACLTLVAFNFVPRKYTAQAEFERRGDAISARTDRKIPESFRTFKPVLKHDLAGPSAIRAALEDLGCFASLPRDASGDYAPEAAARVEAAVNRIQSDVDVQWMVNSENVDRVLVSFRSSDPAMTHKLPNQLVANYIRRTTQDLREQLTTSSVFLSEQLKAARQQIDTVREQQFRFAADHPDMMPDNPQFFLERLNQVDNDLEDLRQRRKALESQLAVLQGLRDDQGDVPAIMKANPTYLTASSEVQQLRKQLNEALTVGQMTPKHPKVIKLQAAIEAAERSLTQVPSEVAAGPAAVGMSGTLVLSLSEMRSELDRVTSQIARKEEVRTQYEKTQANLLPVMQEYQRLSNQLADAEKEAREWQANLADVQMALNAELNGTRTHLTQVKLASPVYQPSWPPLWLMFGAAFAGGPAFGIALVIVLSRLSRSFGSADQARVSLGVPVLGVIGPIFSPAHSRLRSLRRYALTPALASLLLAVTALAGTGVLMASKYPERYARIMDQAGPTARAMVSGVQSLLGSL